MAKKKPQAPPPETSESYRGTRDDGVVVHHPDGLKVGLPEDETELEHLRGTRDDGVVHHHPDGLQVGGDDEADDE